MQFGGEAKKSRLCGKDMIRLCMECEKKSRFAYSIPATKL